MFLTNRGTPEYYFPYTQIRAVAHMVCVVILLSTCCLSRSQVLLYLSLSLLYLCITVCNTRVLIYVQIIQNNSKYIFHRHLRANQGQKILPAPAAQISAWNCQSQIDSCILFMHIHAYSCIFSSWVRVKNPRTSMAYINRWRPKWMVVVWMLNL